MSAQYDWQVTEKQFTPLTDLSDEESAKRLEQLLDQLEALYGKEELWEACTSVRSAIKNFTREAPKMRTSAATTKKPLTFTLNWTASGTLYCECTTCQRKSKTVRSPLPHKTASCFN